MKSLETGKDKIQKICDALRTETLEPARQEAREIIENAHLQAAELIRNAKDQVESLIQGGEREVEEKKKALASSLQLACRQGIEHLKQAIEEQILFQGLADLTHKEMTDPKLIAHMINGFLKALEEKGIEEEINAVIPRGISPRTINALLVEQFLEKLKGKTVSLGDFDGGVQMKLLDRKITIDISDRAVRDLLAEFIRRDFRDLVFQE
jgi:V/A-type H+-transporting ATPase subunit E